MSGCVIVTQPVVGARAPPFLLFFCLGHFPSALLPYGRRMDREPRSGRWCVSGSGVHQSLRPPSLTGGRPSSPLRPAPLARRPPVPVARSETPSLGQPVLLTLAG